MNVIAIESNMSWYDLEPKITLSVGVYELHMYKLIITLKLMLSIANTHILYKLYDIHTLKS